MQSQILGPQSARHAWQRLKPGVPKPVQACVVQLYWPQDAPVVQARLLQVPSIHSGLLKHTSML